MDAAANLATVREPAEGPAQRRRGLLAPGEPLALRLETAVGAKAVFPLGLSRHLALTALFLMCERGYEARKAVEVARGLFEARPDLAPGTLKKCASEAHALVAFVRDQGRWTSAIWIALRTPEARLDYLEAVMSETPLRAALTARAAALRGAKGGRPRRGDGQRQGGALDAVLNAMKSAALGDSDAIEELNSVRALLRLDPREA